MGRNLHKSGSSSGTITKCLKVARSPFQAIASMKGIGVRDETKAKDSIMIMAEPGKSVSFPTVKLILDRRGLKSHSVRKKPLLPKAT
uniref:Transposase Tc1-like domain-containing protein n=1 Tax=Fundulus heteroclitus TaxID=8078 RepID=A0A3Q2SS84_FUNHE